MITFTQNFMKVELSVQQRNATTDSGQCWNKDYGKLNLKYNAVDH